MNIMLGKAQNIADRSHGEDCTGASDNDGDFHDVFRGITKQDGNSESTIAAGKDSRTETKDQSKSEKCQQNSGEKGQGGELRAGDCGKKKAEKAQEGDDGEGVDEKEFVVMCVAEQDGGENGEAAATENPHVEVKKDKPEDIEEAIAIELGGLSFAQFVGGEAGLDDDESRQLAILNGASGQVDHATGGDKAWDGNGSEGSGVRWLVFEDEESLEAFCEGLGIGSDGSVDGALLRLPETAEQVSSHGLQKWQPAEGETAGVDMRPAGGHQVSELMDGGNGETGPGSGVTADADGAPTEGDVKDGAGSGSGGEVDVGRKTPPGSHSGEPGQRYWVAKGQEKSEGAAQQLIAGEGDSSSRPEVEPVMLRQIASDGEMIHVAEGAEALVNTGNRGGQKKAEDGPSGRGFTGPGGRQTEGISLRDQWWGSGNRTESLIRTNADLGRVLEDAQITLLEEADGHAAGEKGTSGKDAMRGQGIMEAPDFSFDVAGGGDNRSQSLPGQLSAGGSLPQSQGREVLEEAYQSVVTQSRYLQVGDTSEMTINLEPPELGKMRLKVVNRKDSLDIKIEVERAQVRGFFRRNAGRLEEMLQDVQPDRLDTTISDMGSGPHSGYTEDQQGGFGDAQSREQGMDKEITPERNEGVSERPLSVSTGEGRINCLV